MKIYFIVNKFWQQKNRKKLSLSLLFLICGFLTQCSVPNKIFKWYCPKKGYIMCTNLFIYIWCIYKWYERFSALNFKCFCAILFDINGAKSGRLIICICFLEIQIGEKKNFFLCKTRKFLHFGEVQKLCQDVESFVEFKNCRTKKLLQTADTVIVPKKHLVCL